MNTKGDLPFYTRLESGQSGATRMEMEMNSNLKTNNRMLFASTYIHVGVVRMGIHREIGMYLIGKLGKPRDGTSSCNLPERIFNCISADSAAAASD